MASKTAMLNRPGVYEVIEVPQGVKKVNCVLDPKTNNCGVFTIYAEDATLGHMLKTQLLKDDSVVFASYRMPHPLENKLELRIQTVDGCTPYSALYSSLHVLLNQATCLQRSFAWRKESGMQ